MCAVDECVYDLTTLPLPPSLPPSLLDSTYFSHFRSLLFDQGNADISLSVVSPFPSSRPPSLPPSLPPSDSTYFNHFRSLLFDQEDADISFVVGLAKDRVPAHKVILTARYAPSFPPSPSSLPPSLIPSLLPSPFLLQT